MDKPEVPQFTYEKITEENVRETELPVYVHGMDSGPVWDTEKPGRIWWGIAFMPLDPKKGIAQDLTFIFNEAGLEALKHMADGGLAYLRSQKEQE